MEVLPSMVLIYILGSIADDRKGSERPSMPNIKGIVLEGSR